MKQILIILCLIWGTVQAQTIGYLRYDSVKIAKPGGNAELIIENATKAVTGGVLTNTGNGRSAWVTPAVGSTPTWQQTLTSGSTLTGDNTVAGAGYSLTFDNNLQFSAIGELIQLVGTSGGKSSSISVLGDSLDFHPHLGVFSIDTLNYSANADDSMMVWSNANGGAVGMRAIPSGGSGANTALSNLTITSIVETPIGAGVNIIKNRTGQIQQGGEVAFFGDSYTAGSGASVVNKRWTTQVVNAMGATEINYGVAGVTLEDQIPVNYMAAPNAVDDTVRIPYKTKYRKMLVFAYGLNDMGQTAAAYNTTNYISDYTLVLNNAIAKGWLPNEILLIPPYWIGTAGYNAYAVITGNAAPTVARHEAFVAATQTVSQTFNTMYFDIFTDQKNNDTTLLAVDNIHPNDAGYAFIAGDIMQYLGIEKPVPTLGANVSFSSVTNITNLGSNWITSSGVNYGQTGLETRYNLPANQNGRLIMTGDSEFGVLGYNSANAQVGFAGMEAAFLLDNTGLIFEVEGGAATSTGITVAATTLVALLRDGSAFVIQTSTDEGKTWTTVHTLAYTSTAVHYIVCDIRGTAAPGIIYNPQFSTGNQISATTSLNNLASVAINTSLISDANNTDDLGSASLAWRTAYMGTSTITPIVYGGTGTTSTLQLRSTSGSGTTNSDIIFGDNNTEWMRIINTGSVGINTTTPEVVNGTTFASSKLQISNVAASTYVVTNTDLNIGGSGILFNRSAASANLRLWGIDSQPDVSNTSSKLTVSTFSDAGSPTNMLTMDRNGIMGLRIPNVTVQYDNNTTTLGNVTGLTYNVIAGKKYKFTAKLYTTSNVGGGIKVAIGGTATATSIIYEGLTTDAGLTTQGRGTALGTAVAGVTAVTAAFVTIEGTIVVNAAGTLTVQAAANAAVGTTSVLVGSTFLVTECL